MLKALAALATRPVVARREDENEERSEATNIIASSLRSSWVAQRAVIVLVANSLHRQQQFGIIYQKEYINDISPPLNMPYRYEDYSKGRVLISMNTTNDSRNYACEGGDCMALDGEDTEGAEYVGTWVDEGGPNSVYTPTILEPFDELRSDSAWWDNPFNTYLDAKENSDMFFETFHGSKIDTSGTFTWDFEDLVLPYLPFFSNCREFDSHIPFWALMESPMCELPEMDGEPPNDQADYESYLGTERWDLPALPHIDDIVPVGPFDMFQFTPVADYCTLTVYCDYEEKLEQRDTVPRWMEVQSGNSLFDIVRRPISYLEYVWRAKPGEERSDEPFEHPQGPPGTLRTPAGATTWMKYGRLNFGL